MAALPPVVSDALNPNYIGLVNLWVGTQADYDELTSKDDLVLYLVVE